MQTKSILRAADLLSNIPTKPSIRVRKEDKQKLINGLQAKRTNIFSVLHGISIIESETIPSGFAIFFQARNSEGKSEVFTIKLT